jgi:hypothetical protein
MKDGAKEWRKERTGTERSKEGKKRRTGRERRRTDRRKKRDRSAGTDSFIR